MTGINRYFILILSLLLLTFNYSCFMVYNASFVTLTAENATNNQDLPLSSWRFKFSPTEKGVAYASPFVGSMVAVLLKGHFLKMFGGHLIFTLSSTLATLIVFLTPLSLSYSFYFFTFLRFLQGFTVSNLLTLVGMITNSWASLKQRGLFVAVLSSYSELGALITLATVGSISSIFGWPSVFYFHGGILAILTLLWVLYHRDTPDQHPFMGNQELQKINCGKKVSESSEDLEIPVVQILTSPIVWSLLLSVVSSCFLFQFTISFATIYLKQVLDVPSSHVGLITQTPLSVALVIKFVCGYLSDRLKYSELFKIKVFNTIGIMGPAFIFLILSFTKPGTSKLFDIVLVCLPIALLGFSSAGFPKCTVLIAGKFTPFVMTIFQMAVGVSCFASSFLVPTITVNDSVREWSTVFLIYGLLLTFSNTVFLIFATSEPASWAQST